METLQACTGGRRQITFRDVQLSPSLGSSPWEHYCGMLLHDPGVGMILRDDFTKLDTAATNGQWATVKGTGGSLSLSGNTIHIPTAASANDYMVLTTQQAAFALTNYTPIVIEAYVNVTEAATNLSSWFFGLSSVTTTGFLSNAGAPPASYSGFVFWKATGAMALKAQASNATVQTSTGTLATVASGQSYILGAYLDPNDGVTGTITYWVSTVVSGVRSLVATGSVSIALASLATMFLQFGIRAGGSGAETMTLDYVQAYQTRVLF